MFFNFGDPFPSSRQCTILYNGPSNLSLNIDLYKNITLQTIQDAVAKAWKVRIFHFRLFNQDGIEIFQEDLEFIRNKSKLYASFGQDFDTKATFQEYLITKKLGEGGFGKVLLGQHRTTGLKVAIKIVNTNAIGNAEDIDMVFREAELLKSLDHKNIVKILNCYTLSNMQVVFIMEYLEGGELLQYLEERGTLQEEEAKVFFIQICEAMQYCHQRKLIHRDLKLENILLAQQNGKKIKIVDFGIAGLAMNMNVDKIDVGSLRYMAPETLNGKSKQIGPFIDVWAIGVILYCLVFGQLPFGGNTMQEIIYNIMTISYTVPNNASSELVDLLSRIFILDVNKRIKLKDILNHEWVSDGKDMPVVKKLDLTSNTLNNSGIGKKVRLGQVTAFNLQVPTSTFRLVGSPRVMKKGGSPKEIREFNSDAVKMSGGFGEGLRLRGGLKGGGGGLKSSLKQQEKQQQQQQQQKQQQQGQGSLPQIKGKVVQLKLTSEYLRQFGEVRKGSEECVFIHDKERLRKYSVR